MANKPPDEESKTKKYDDNGAVVFLYILLAYQSVGIYWMIRAVFDAMNGVSGTEYVGFFILIYFSIPSFILLMIYSLLLLFRSNKLTKNAIHRRKIALYLNYLAFIAVFVAPSIIDSIFN